MAMILSALLRRGKGPRVDLGVAPLDAPELEWRPKPLEEIVGRRKRPGPGLIERTRELLTRGDLSPQARDQQIWDLVRQSDPPIADWRLRRWEENPERRMKALDDLKDVARNLDRYDAPTDTLAKWWAAGWEPDPGTWERQHPPPPARTVGQWVGWETDPHAAERPQSALGAGIAHGWLTYSSGKSRDFSRLADLLGNETAAERFLADADREGVLAAERYGPDQWKYDPSGNLAWHAGDYVGRKAPARIEDLIKSRIGRTVVRRR